MRCGGYEVLTQGSYTETDNFVQKKLSEFQFRKCGVAPRQNGTFGAMAEGKRQHPRFALQIQAEVRFTNWTVFTLLYTVNISKGGMNLQLGESPAIGSRLQVRLVLPDGWPTTIDAIVRHVTPMEAVAGQTSHALYQVGVQFENLDDERKALIEQTILKHGTPTS